jgi:hypothetical protein
MADRFNRTEKDNKKYSLLLEKVLKEAVVPADEQELPLDAVNE